MSTDMKHQIEMANDKPFGMFHPTWAKPSGFWWATAEETWAAILRIYGKDSQHVVVKRTLCLVER